VTCSLLREENEDQVNAFLAASEGFLPLDAAHAAKAVGVESLGQFASKFGPGLRLSPATSNTDGFYTAIMLRS
jgi:16S rRNA (cytosine967-C5)-methyltransferase